MKNNLLTRSLAAKLFLVVAATLFFSTISTPSQAFGWGWGHHHHWHHWKKFKKPVGKTQTLLGSRSTPVAAQYAAASIVCATVSVMAQAAMATGPLSTSQAHGAAAGCFLPFLGQWLLVGHYQRMCALSRTNPALREYRIYCAS